MNGNEQTLSTINKWQVSAAVIGGIGLAISALAFFADQTRFFQGYLFAFIFWANVTLGCLGVNCIVNMIRSKWGVPSQRMLEAGSRNLLLMVVFFLVVLAAVFMHKLYPWALPKTDPLIAGSKSMQKALEFTGKPLWFQPWFFALRSGIYFLIWMALAGYLNASSIRQDRTGDANETNKRASMGAAGVVIFMLSVTLMSTDWVMSLDPRWFSTIFGAWLAVCQGMAATCLVTVLMIGLRRARPYSDLVTPAMTRDYGNVLLTFTMFWGYFSLSQWLIIYSGNLPEEIRYYTNRGLGANATPNFYWYVGTIVTLCQFFIPFLCLISGRTKRTPNLLFMVAGGIFIIRAIDIFWTIVPFLHPANSGGGINLLGTALAAFFGIGGIWMAVFFAHLKKYPLIPLRAEVVEEVLEHA